MVCVFVYFYFYIISIEHTILTYEYEHCIQIWRHPKKYHCDYTHDFDWDESTVKITYFTSLFLGEGFFKGVWNLIFLRSLISLLAAKGDSNSNRSFWHSFYCVVWVPWQFIMLRRKTENSEFLYHSSFLHIWHYVLRMHW